MASDNPVHTQRPYLFDRDLAVASKYNTYHTKGLPVGAICSVSDASLSAAASTSEDGNVFYFFYDYVRGDMSFFSGYTRFRKQASVSRKRFDQTSSVGAHAKINKQALRQPSQTAGVSPHPPDGEQSLIFNKIPLTKI